MAKKMRKAVSDMDFGDEYISKKEAIIAVTNDGCTANVVGVLYHLTPADVVPKSDSLPLDVHEALKQQAVEKAKAEVAREIFEEIEKEIDLALSVVTKILNAKGGRANGKTILISKYDVFIEAKKYIAKLKKKYTGEKECPQCEHFVGCECFDGGLCDEYNSKEDKS